MQMNQNNERDTVFYRGWKVTYHPNLPKYGCWRAEHFGVSMSTSSRGNLVEMIDEKIRAASVPLGMGMRP